MRSKKISNIETGKLSNSTNQHKIIPTYIALSPVFSEYILLSGNLEAFPLW
jgi:hypothetical protein